MTWAEFQLRLIGFNKSEERDLYKVRRIAYASIIGPHYDPNKLRSMTEQKFMPITDKDRPKVSEAHKQRFIEEYKKYLDKKEHGRT